MRTGDFGLPAECSATYDVELVNILRAVTRVGARSALEDYCRSYADEHGYRPSAVQAYEAGYNPSSARTRYGHWFAFLDDLELLTEQEREVARRHADVLAGIEKESITKSYKLVTLQALLQTGRAAHRRRCRRDRLDRAPDRHGRPAPGSRHEIGRDA